MTTTKGIRLKKGKIETEIEKLRSESSWGKVLETIGPHKTDSSLSHLYYLVLCESKLEHFEHNFLSDDDITFAERCLSEASKSTDEQYVIESSILRGKTFYLRKNFSEALKRLRVLNLQSLRIDNFSLRFARNISEGLSIIGLCIEELALAAGKSLTEEERTEVLLCYEQAGEICIRHFQDLYQANSENWPSDVSFPKLVFNAIRQSVLLVQHSGNVAEPVAKYRFWLRFVEIPSTRTLRQWLAFQFAELLLRGVCVTTYQKYDAARANDDFRLKNCLPYRYPVSRFVPDSLYEEVVLMLFISERIASQEVILNRPSESSDMRITESFNNTSAVYDLLTIAMARIGNYSLLSKTLEKSLKFSYREFHTWFQFALSLISTGKHYRAYLVLRECLRLNPKKLSVLFLSSSLCFGRLGFLEDGLELAVQAVEVTASRQDPVMSARAHLMLGWGYSLLARKCRVVSKKTDLQKQATAEYKTATRLDPDDHLSWYHMGVELATQRLLDDALLACQNSLRLRPSHTNTLCLLALLHTAGRKRMDQASKVLRVGLADKPNDFNLLLLLAKLEAVRQNPKSGLLVYRRLLEGWRDLFVPDSSNPLDGLGEPHDPSVITTSGSDGHLSTVLPTFGVEDELALPTSLADDNPMVSNLVQIADGRVGRTGASILPNPSSSSAPLLLNIQARIYHGLAELYLENNQLNEAQDALDEAVKITGLDVETLYLRGCLTEKQGNSVKARSIYESVLAIQPDHLRVHLSLTNLLCETGQATLAERIIRDAMAIDPACSEVWRLLAKTLTLPSAREPASDAAVTKALFNAVELSQTEPLESFCHLPIGINCHQ